MTQQKAHILIFPFPSQGHLIPVIDFAHQLSIRGLDITILITPKNVHLLTPIITKNPSIQTLVLPLPTHNSTPPRLENDKDIPVVGLWAVMNALFRLQDPIKEWFRAHPSPPTAIIFDGFLGWANSLAGELGIPGYVFSTSGALALSVIYSLWRNFPKRDNPNNDGELITFHDLPNSPVYPWRQLSSVYRSYTVNENDPASEIVKAGFVGDLASFGLVINTVNELENVYLDHLKEVLGHDRVWTIGPLLPPADRQSQSQSSLAERGGTSSIPANEVLEWLDNCKEQNSVLYVCFGSQFELSPVQMEALALGLEKSGVKFILAIKGHSPTKGNKEGCSDENHNGIPFGFEEKVQGRGLVIKGWAPQVLILRHPCVGAFLTHCGWNSVFEGIEAGVPMLAWPIGADQFSIATLIVDELKIGCRVCESDETVPDSDRLAGILAKATGDFREERKKVLGFQKAVFDAVQEGGTSFENLNALALHLSDTNFH